MTLDQLFLCYRSQVHPLFWPVLLIGLRLYQARKIALYEQGCQGLMLRISWWGGVFITHAIFPDAPAGWKDDLYAAAGAYGARQPPCPPLVQDVQRRASACANAWVSAVANLLRLVGGLVQPAGSIRAERLKASHAHLKAALLPRPDT